MITTLAQGCILLTNSGACTPDEVEGVFEVYTDTDNIIEKILQIESDPGRQLVVLTNQQVFFRKYFSFEAVRDNLLTTINDAIPELSDVASGSEFTESVRRAHSREIVRRASWVTQGGDPDEPEELSCCPSSDMN